MLNRLSTMLSENAYCFEYYLSNIEHCLSTIVEQVCLNKYSSILLTAYLVIFF